MDNTNDTNNIEEVQTKIEENNNNVDTQIKSKSKFVPSYKKSKEETNKNGDSRDKKQRKSKSKTTIGIVIFSITLLLLVLIILFINMGNKNVSDYNKLMDDYGLSILYKNETSNPSDKITRAEAVKMVVAATLNTTEITKYMSNDLLYQTKKIEQTTESSDGISLDEIFNQVDTQTKIEEKYENEYWVRYAKSVKFIEENEINEQNYNEEISYIEGIKYIAKAKTALLGKVLDIDKIPQFKDYDEYDNVSQWYLADLAYNEILEDSKSKINGNKALTKNDFNELIIKYILKYNLITTGQEKININEEKMPQNKDEYPYTLANVNKDIYEIPRYIANENSKTSIEVFKYIKKYYELINTKVESYCNALVNIDYETITVDDMYTKIIPETMYILTEEKLQQYVEYVKQNKIKITGTSKVQNPIIYFDGESYRVRTKITYNIQNSQNLNNVFLLDEKNEYKNGEQTIYIDVPVEIDTSYNDVYIVPQSFTNMIAGKVNNK